MSARVLIVAVVVIALLAGAVVVTRRRDSRPYHLLSTMVSPISTRLTTDAGAEPITPPYEPDLRGPIDPEWRWFQPDLVQVVGGSSTFSLAAASESVWWKNERGPMLYRSVTGDVSVVAVVRARKRSDNTRPPDEEWQFAGIILRDPRADALLSRENYVFNVVGHRGQHLQIETKSTVQGRSRVDAWDWESGDAELMLERRGPQFLLYARPDPHSPWRHLITYHRPDLPHVLQLGLIVYAYSEGRGKHDLQAFFDRLWVR